MDKKLLERFQRLCIKRECCTSEIYSKALKALEGDAEGAAEIVKSLVDDKFVDDFRYAAAFAREKASLTGWGPIKIKFALRAKKVPSEAIEAAFEDVDTGKAEEKLRKLIEAKRHSLEGDPQIRLKLIKFALSRGYDYVTVEKFVK